MEGSRGRRRFGSHQAETAHRFVVHPVGAGGPGPAFRLGAVPVGDGLVVGRFGPDGVAGAPPAAVHRVRIIPGRIAAVVGAIFTDAPEGESGIGIAAVPERLAVHPIDRHRGEKVRHQFGESVGKAGVAHFEPLQGDAGFQEGALGFGPEDLGDGAVE